MNTSDKSDDELLRPLQGMHRAEPALDLFDKIESRLDAEAEILPLKTTNSSAAELPHIRHFRWALAAAAALLLTNVLLLQDFGTHAGLAPLRSPAPAPYAGPDAGTGVGPGAGTNAGTALNNIQLTNDFTLYD